MGGKQICEGLAFTPQSLILLFYPFLPYSSWTHISWNLPQHATYAFSFTPCRFLCNVLPGPARPHPPNLFQPPPIWSRLNSGSLKFISTLLELQNMTLFGKRLFAEVIKQGSWDKITLDLGWTLSAMTSIPRIEEKTQRHRGRRPCGDEGKGWSYVATNRERSSTTRSWKRIGEDPPLGPLKGAWPFSYLIWDFWLPELRE